MTGELAPGVEVDEADWPEQHHALIGLIGLIGEDPYPHQLFGRPHAGRGI
ncbi:MAG: hypothetical protein J0H43_14985 [Actinobacteria bacterium]|nr:hypothetical protein [Actinomycetota bacterium]